MSELMVPIFYMSKPCMAGWNREWASFWITQQSSTLFHVMIECEE